MPDRRDLLKAAPLVAIATTVPNSTQAEPSKAHPVEIIGDRVETIVVKWRGVPLGGLVRILYSWDRKYLHEAVFHHAMFAHPGLNNPPDPEVLADMALHGVDVRVLLEVPQMHDHTSTKPYEPI